MEMTYDIHFDNKVHFSLRKQVILLLPADLPRCADEDAGRWSQAAAPAETCRCGKGNISIFEVLMCLFLLF